MLTEGAQEQQQQDKHEQQQVYSSIDEEELEQLSAYKEVIGSCFRLSTVGQSLP